MQPEIDLSDPIHPRLPINPLEADLLLVLLKVDFALRISDAVKSGGKSKDSSKVMEQHRISEYLELITSVSFVLLKAYIEEETTIPCPVQLQAYLQSILTSKVLNNPEIQYLNDDSGALYEALQRLGPGILSKISNLAPSFTQFTLNGPARA